MAFTFFFRDLHTLEHVVKNLIPEVSGRSRIRIWDAGCANGPEPYTFSILLSENMGNFAFKNVQITATDIDESGNFGQIISDGIFSHEELGRIPSEIFDKYFSKVEGKEGYSIISQKIRDSVKYFTHDLLSLNPIGENFSLIICKNVLLHFQYEQRIEVIKMFHKALTPGGFLTMEQTQKMPTEISHLFTQVVMDAQLYKKVGE